MGMFSFLSGNYKPSDFANKTLEQIFKEIKLDKVDKSIQQDAEFNALPEETKSAIQMLIDLKGGKNIIYEKCYKSKGSHAHAHAANKPESYHPTVPAVLPRPNAPGSSRPRPVSFAKPAPVPMPVPMPVAADEDEENKEGQTGGGRRRRRKTGKKNKKSRHSKMKKSRKYMRK